MERLTDTLKILLIGALAIVIATSTSCSASRGSGCRATSNYIGYR